MDTIDLLFLVGVLVALTSMLVFSKVMRAIAWESLRHPFTPSRIQVKGDKLEIQHLGQKAIPTKKAFDSTHGAS